MKAHTLEMEGVAAATADLRLAASLHSSRRCHSRVLEQLELMLVAILVASLVSLGVAQSTLEQCECDYFMNGLKSKDVGSHACAKYEHDTGKLSCMTPPRPFIARLDNGCPEDSYLCTVADRAHLLDFKFPITTTGTVETFNMVQPSFKPCTCTEGANSASPLDCSAGPKPLCQKAGENVCYPLNFQNETYVGELDLWSCRSDQ